MKVFFAKHEKHWCEDCCEGINTGFSPLVLQTAACARHAGFDVTNFTDLPNLAARVATTHEPKAVVFFVALSAVREVAPTIAACKNAGASTILILHDSFDIEDEIMTIVPEIDYAVLYPDRELGIVDLLGYLRDGGALPQSLMYRTDEGLKRTTQRAQVKSLAHLPPFMEMLDGASIGHHTHAYLTVGRGCHFGCGFCDLRRSTNRNRRPEDIAAEMAFIQRHPNLYAREPVSFIHPLFGGDLEWTRNVCNALIESKNRVPWRVTTHYQTIKPDLLTVWRAAGCVKVSMGLEHLNEPTLKPVNLDKFRDAVRNLQDNDIEVFISIIVGIWEDTDESLTMMENYLRSLGKIEVLVTPFYPLRGTPMYDSYIKRDLLPPPQLADYIEWGYSKALIPTKTLSTVELNAWIRRFNAINESFQLNSNPSMFGRVKARLRDLFVGN